MKPSNAQPREMKHATTCPVWLGYLLASPLRRLLEKPDKLVLSVLQPTDRVLKLGPALGYFTLPVAEALGPAGRLVCVDVQESMLRRLKKRLEKRGLLERADLRLCSGQDLGLDGEENGFDLVLALHVVHETPSPEATMTTLARCLKAGGRLLLVEPPGHCPPAVFQCEIAAAEKAGLVRAPHPRCEGRRNLVLWRKPN
jgi:ubiquinone/menaquinone biosynthesis C-methylase UbiE